MRIVKKKSHKKAIIGSILAVVLVAGSTFGYLYYRHTQNATNANNTASAQTINLDPPTQEQVQAGSTQKENAVDNSAKDDANSDPTPTSGSLTVTLTSSNVNNGIQQLRYLISQQLGSGTCTLTLTSGSQTPIVKTAAVEALASSSTCEGFDITTSSMASGQWTAAVTVTNGSESGSTSSTFQV